VDQRSQCKAWNFELLQETLEQTGIGNNFLNSSAIKKTDKRDYMKLKSFCTAKEMVTRLKTQPIEWEKIFASYRSGKGLILPEFTGSSKH
jgi:hypothetical protein